jgi:hypothetical protein
MFWRIALLILLITSVPLAEVEPPDEQALSLLNQYRELASMSRSRSSQW